MLQTSSFKSIIRLITSEQNCILRKLQKNCFDLVARETGWIKRTSTLVGLLRNYCAIKGPLTIA